MKVIVAGGGLAGSEAALQLANADIEVDLYEMRPKINTKAHKTEYLAEFVCSNSLGSKDITNASGLLKTEMRILDCELLKIIDECEVEAGNALAIDRDFFAQKVTQKIAGHKNINLKREEFTKINPDIPTIIASGPLTSQNLADEIKNLTDEKHLHFFDAIAPIVEKNSLNLDIIFEQNRYEKGKAAYLNAPMNKEQYEKFYNFLINAPKIELKEFEKNAKFFESCLPIEVIASRGIDTLRFGPMKPVGLIDKRNKIENYAVVQLRQDNKQKTLYNLVGFQTNLKWSAQKELLQLIPGFENVSIVRYGVMHQNTFINSPKILNCQLQMKKYENIFFAGQITGTEGYTESIAGGLIAGLNMIKKLKNKSLIKLPKTTMLGSLLDYISFVEHKNFQPMNANWGIIESIELPKKERKNKKLKNEILANRAIKDLTQIKSFL